MAANQQHTADALQDGESQLPLYSFFIILKQNGFLVTPAQIVDSNAVIAEYAGKVNNEAELCNYLSPLFANNEEEQVLFTKLYNEHFGEDDKEGLAAGNKKAPLAEHIKTHWWKYIIGLAAIIIGLLFVSRPAASNVKLDVLYLRSNYEGRGRMDGEAFNVNTREPLKVYPQTSDKRRDSIYKITFVTKYDWGDSSEADSTGEHLYKARGIYNLTAFTKVYYNGKFMYSDTLLETVKVCDEINTLSIKSSLGSDSVKINQSFRLNALVEGRKPDSIKWSNGNQWLGIGNTLDTSFSEARSQQIYCVAVYDSTGSACSMEKVITITVYDPNKPILTASIIKASNAKPVVLPRKVKLWWFLLTGVLFLLSFAAMLIFEKWKKKGVRQTAKKQEETDRLYNDLVSNFSGKRPPFDLPFRGKNTLLLAEPGLSEVAWQMRKRIEDESTYLHLQKTINRAIRNAGFFEPVKVPRTHQSEYLVLIDETIINNQQVKLFEWLVELLRKQNVFIDKFYYRKEPKLCYNVFEPSGISLEKLNEKFPRHILFILGNGHQLVYPHYPIFDPTYHQLMSRWKYKAILTPVAPPDWGRKEKNVLSEEMIVVPADVYGQMLLMEHLFRDGAISTGDLNEFNDQFYKVTSIDFEDITELLAYCNKAAWARVASNDPADNILFQWIAALALYPRIRWEMILAIGKRIVEKYGKAEELNFTNLLRISRIKWMSEGQFPDYTRLELLKGLKLENEVVARETILTLLNEIPAHEITADHFVYEEKEIQRIVNEFNLYAYDPVKYASYETSKILFEKLWKDKKILDAPAKVYLKNEEREWSTLVNRKTGTDSHAENVPVDEYLEELPEDTSSLKSIKLWTGFVIAVLFLGSLLALVGLTILNFVNTERFANFTYKKNLAKQVLFTFKDSSNLKQLNIASINIDTSEIGLVADSTVPALINFNDSIKDIAIWVNGEQLSNDSMLINQDAYTVSLKAPPVEQKPLDNFIHATVYYNGSCAAALYDYKRNLSDADRDIVISDSMIDGTAVKSGTCLNRISYGPSVDISMVNRITQNFKSSGIDLTINPQSVYRLKDNEVAIYYQAPVLAAPVRRCTITINLSDESLRASANGFKKELESKGFTVSTMNVGDFDNNSQIGYYDNSDYAEAAEVQKSYRKYYPQLAIPLSYVDNTRLSGIGGVIRIYIKKLEDGSKLPLKLNAAGSKVSELQGILIKAGYKGVKQNSLFDNATQTAVLDFQAKNKLMTDGIVGQVFWNELTKFVASLSGYENSIAPTEKQLPNNPVQQSTEPDKNLTIAGIAGKELGQQENPPGSNKTKYGQWYGKDGVPWSGIFVSWVYTQAGKPLTGIESSKGFASFNTALNYFRKNNMLTDQPVEGDIVIIQSSNGSFSGGIFSGFTRAIGGFSMIAGNSSEKGTADGNAVVDLRMTINPKTTYFAHVPEKVSGY